MARERRSKSAVFRCRGSGLLRNSRPRAGALLLLLTPAGKMADAPAGGSFPLGGGRSSGSFLDIREIASLQSRGARPADVFDGVRARRSFGDGARLSARAREPAAGATGVHSADRSRGFPHAGA